MRVLVLATRHPGGPPSGRKAVLQTIVTCLARLGYEVVLVHFCAPEGPPVPGAVVEHRLALPGPLEVAWNLCAGAALGHWCLNECLYLRRANRGILRRIGADCDLVVLDMVRVAPYLVCFAGKRRILDLDDLLSLRYCRWRGMPDLLLGYFHADRHALVTALLRSAPGLLLKVESRLVARREMHLARVVDAVSLVNPAEARLLSRRAGVAVANLPMMVETPAASRWQIPAIGCRLVFLGNMTYWPNCEAVQCFRDHVLPTLDGDLSDVTMTVIGPVSEATRRQLAGPRIEFRGFVPELADELSGHWAFCAPILSGTGIKAKVVTAMMHGLPVLTTPAGASGLDVTNGREILIAAEVAGMATLLRWMRRHPQRVAMIARNGREHALRTFSPTAIQSRWETLLKGLNRHGGRRLGRGRLLVEKTSPKEGRR